MSEIDSAIWAQFEEWARSRFGPSFEDIAKTGVLGMCFDAWQAALASRPVEPVEGERRAIEFGIRHVIDAGWKNPVSDEEVRYVWQMWLVEREVHE